MNLNDKIDKSEWKEVSMGNSEAFEKIFRIFYPKTHRFAMMLLKNKDDADDVCQLVFMKLWIRRERLAVVNSLDAYLFMLTKYTILDYLSIHKITTTTLVKAHETVDELTPYEQLVAGDTKLLIDMVVENMPPQRQTIYKMSREQHKKNEEIAQELGITKKTVENHLNLALKDIKKALRLAMLVITLWV